MIKSYFIRKSLNCIKWIFAIVETGGDIKLISRSLLDTYAFMLPKTKDVMKSN